MSHLYGWPSPERCQELYHLWNIYQLFPSFFVRTEEILAVGVSNWHIPVKETGLLHSRDLSPSQPGWNERVFWWALLLCLRKVFPNNGPEHSKMQETKQPKNYKLVSGIINWIFELKIYCFAFLKPFFTGIQDKLIAYLKLNCTCNK